MAFFNFFQCGDKAIKGFLIYKKNLKNKLKIVLQYFPSGLPCKLVLPQFGSTKCREIRKRELHHQRMFYRFTNPPSPNDPDRKLDDLIAPQLNQTESNAYNMFMVDPFSAHWFNLWALVLGRTIRDKIHPQATQFFRAMNVTNYHDYNNILQFYSNGIKVSKVRDTPVDS